MSGIPELPDDYRSIVFSIVTGDVLGVDRPPYKFRSLTDDVGVGIYGDIPGLGYCKVAMVKLEGTEWCYYGCTPNGDVEMGRVQLDARGIEGLKTAGIEPVEEK